MVSPAVMLTVAGENDVRLIDTVFVAVYVPLLWHAWRWLGTKETAGPPSPLRSLTLSDNPYPRAVPIVLLAAAVISGLIGEAKDTIAIIVIINIKL